MISEGEAKTLPVGSGVKFNGYEMVVASNNGTTLVLESQDERTRKGAIVTIKVSYDSLDERTYWAGLLERIQML